MRKMYFCIKDELIVKDSKVFHINYVPIRMAKKREIRNSTAEFLIFQIEGKEQGVEVLYADETVWCTQDAIALLFDKGRSTIAEHLQNIFKENELQRDAVCRKFRRTASDGKEYNIQYYRR